MNDLWRWDPQTGLWTWLSGSNAPFANSAFGTMGVAAAGNVVGSRQGHAMSLYTTKGDLVTFGGRGYIAGSLGKLVHIALKRTPSSLSQGS